MAPKLTSRPISRPIPWMHARIFAFCLVLTGLLAGAPMFEALDAAAAPPSSGAQAEIAPASATTDQTAVPVIAIAMPSARPADWVRTVTLAPNGAYVLGNPAAPVRLVEYLSYSCTHCGDFARLGFPLLRDYYIAKGTVAYEVRNVLRDRFDVTAALMARCGGSDKFFPLTQALFGAQYNMLLAAYDYERATPKVAADRRATQTRDFVRKVGLEAFMTRRGFTSAQVESCLFNQQATAQISSMSREAHERYKVFATPYFLVNDRPVPALDWTQLRPAIDAALAQARGR